MLSQKYPLLEKDYGCYIFGVILLITGLYFGHEIYVYYTRFGWLKLYTNISGDLVLASLFSIAGIAVGILTIYAQYYYNHHKVPLRNILHKYIKYIELKHPEIPEKYHEALLFNLRDCHISSFGCFDEIKKFSSDELDQHIKYL